MLDFYFKVVFNDDRNDEFIHVLAPTSMLAWDILSEEIKILEWDNINYSETKMIFMNNFQQSNGKFFENFSKSINEEVEENV